MLNFLTCTLLVGAMTGICDWISAECPHLCSSCWCHDSIFETQWTLPSYTPIPAYTPCSDFTQKLLNLSFP
ncbi:hypothetical protein EDD17DRAFT_1640427 [Pisolithus thermaeus]|nr:hypothetical protein EDD17DRAFT_1640427 [Pisolithus thermaeus]